MAVPSSQTSGTRQAVLNEARKGFASKGFHAVSMRDIARSVGVQQSAIYNHFSNKQSILFELLSRNMEVLIANLDETLDDKLSPTDRLRAFAQFHTEYHIDYPEDVFIAYMELRSLNPDNFETLILLRNAYERKLRSIVEAGIKEDHFSCIDASVHTRALIAMLTGVTVWFKAHGSLDRCKVVECYVNAAVQSVGGKV